MSFESHLTTHPLLKDSLVDASLNAHVSVLSRLQHLKFELVSTLDKEQKDGEAIGALKVELDAVYSELLKESRNVDNLSHRLDNLVQQMHELETES